MKSQELRRKKESLLAEMDILAKGEYGETEQKAFEAKEAEVKALEKEIAAEDKREEFQRLRAATTGRTVSEKEQRDIQQYSLAKAVKEFMAFRNGTGNLTGIEMEMHQEAIRENAGIGAIQHLGIPSTVLAYKTMKQRSTLASGSSPVVQTDNVGFIDALWARTMLAEMGAKFLPGLTGNLDLPYLATAPSVAWAATENATAVDGAAAFDKHSLTPKRITSFIPVSNLLFIQSNKAIEQIIWSALERAVRVKLEAGAINGSGDTGEPTGILGTSGIGSVAIGTNGGAPTLSKLLSLVEEVAIDNAELGSLFYLTNPKVRRKAMETVRVSSTDSKMIWDADFPNTLLGYNARISTLVPSTLTKGTSSGVCSAAIFGNFNDLTIGQFGALELKVDDLTAAKTAITNLIIHSYWDLCLDHAESFAAVKDLTTT